MSNIENDIKSIIIDKLQTLSVCKPNSSMTQWVVRCPYCGDSHHQDHGHFSIKIDVTDNSNIVYRCFKCPAHGPFTKSTLDDLGLGADNVEIQKLRALHSNASKVSNKANRRYEIPPPKNNHDTMIKLEYMSERLGYEFTFEDIFNYRIIINLSDFIKFNKIDESIFNSNIIQELSRNYIGFLVYNHSKIIFRQINQSYLKRYYNLRLYDGDNQSFYTIPTTFDPLYTDDIHIHIAEGVFDIIQAQNISKNLYDNSIYVAIGSFDYHGVIKRLITMGITTNITLHIWSDNDKSDEEHYKIINSMLVSIWMDKIIIHRNMYKDMKDFGVPLDSIIHNQYQIR